MKPYAGTTIFYNTETGMTGYVWTVTGGEIILGQGTQQISVKWDCSVSAGHIKVNYANENGCTANVATDSIVAKQANPKPTITGTTTPRAEVLETYTTQFGKSAYIWSVNGGYVIAGQGTDAVTIRWTGNAGYISVSYKDYECSTPNTSDKLNVTISHYYNGGAGTSSDPYRIATAEQLANIPRYPNATFCLAKDIDLTDYLKTSSTGWTPISNFSGSLDGRFFKIKGLWINQPNSDKLGLFDINSGIIEKLYVEIDSKGIYGNNYIGGLVARNIGNISQCAVTEGSITAKGDYIGGLVGRNGNFLDIKYSKEGIIVESYSSNTVVWGNQYVGGLAGSNRGHVFSDGYYGGYSQNAKIHQCYSNNTVVGSGYVGGLVGDMDIKRDTSWGPTATVTLSQSYSAGIVSGGNYTGGLLGYNDKGTITGCYFDEETSQQYDGLGNSDDSQAKNIAAKYTSDMMKQKTFLAWDFSNVWKISELESYPYFKWQDIIPTPPPSGIKNIEKDNTITVYPNPTDGIVYINCEVNALIQGYSLSGNVLLQFVSQSEKETIDLSGYSKGVYIIKIGNQFARLIKK